MWQRIAAVAPYDRAQEVLKWIGHKVDVHEFLAPFKEDYKGQSYQSDFPPHRLFKNSISCKSFVKCISRTIIDRLASGAISVWGRVNEVEPPHLVTPLTVEPTKPRLCNDNRFLNLWIKDCPFNLDSIGLLASHYFCSVSIPCSLTLTIATQGT